MTSTGKSKHSWLECLLNVHCEQHGGAVGQHGVQRASASSPCGGSHMGSWLLSSGRKWNTRKKEPFLRPPFLAISLYVHRRCREASLMHYNDKRIFLRLMIKIPMASISYLVCAEHRDSRTWWMCSHLPGNDTAGRPPNTEEIHIFLKCSIILPCGDPGCTNYIGLYLVKKIVKAIP